MSVLRWSDVTKRNVSYVLFAIMVCYCADLSYTTFALHLDDLVPTSLINVTADLIGSYICLVLYGTILSDRRKTQESFHFLMLTFFELLILNADATNWMVDGDPGKGDMLMVANILLFVIILIIAKEAWHVIQVDLDIPRNIKRELDLFLLVMMFIGAANAILNPWTGFIFHIDTSGYYVRSEYIGLANIPAATMTLTIMGAALKFGKNRRRKIAVVAYALVPIIATFLQLEFYGLSFIYISLILSLLLIYGNYYVSRGTDLLIMDTALTEQRYAVMYSQIQPHFLYNSLTSIMNIKGNPQETVDALSDFGKFLRGNLDSLSTKNPIPLKKELEHVEIYVDLEKRRFKDRLSIEYDIQDTSFFVPSLSMQMLVENAIKHGITTRESGGSVRISTYQDEHAHYIRVEDDGVGFDTDKPFNDETSHVGLTNLGNRLENMVNGKLAIESQVGKGTVTTISIPKNHH